MFRLFKICLNRIIKHKREVGFCFWNYSKYNTSPKQLSLFGVQPLPLHFKVNSRKIKQNSVSSRKGIKKIKKKRSALTGIRTRVVTATAWTTNVCTNAKKNSRGWFRSIDLWVMSPTRSRCATLLQADCWNYLFIPYFLLSRLQTNFKNFH